MKGEHRGKTGDNEGGIRMISIEARWLVKILKKKIMERTKANTT
jgi:hypothetical protein